MVKLNHISKHYIDGKKVVTGLNDVTLSFGVDEFVVVTGSSGSGKSTLLNILSGTDYATSGQYLVDDIDTDSFDEKDWSNFRCRNIGIIYQDNKLIENYTVKENIEAAIALCCSKKKERKKKINQILKDTGLATLANKRVKYLSGGQKQRVAIARAISKDCRILLADEPTANLDVDTAYDIVRLLKEISKDRLVIVVTHNEEQFVNVATRRIILSEGGVLSDKIFKIKEDNHFTIEFNKCDPSKKAFSYGILKYAKPIASIFLTTLIVLFCSLISYSVSLDMSNNRHEGLTNTEFFQNLSPERYIISKTDKTAFTKDDLELIKAKSEIDNVVLEDIILDTVGYIENPGTKRDMELYIKPLSALKEVDYGRLPQNDDEVVLSNDIGGPFYMMESDEEYFSLRTDDIILHKVRIVGWLKDTDHFRQSVYVSEKLMQKLYVCNYHKYSEISLIEDNISYPIYNVIPDTAVVSGTIIVGDDKLSGKNLNFKLNNIQRSLEMDDLTSVGLDNYPSLATKYGNLNSFIIINYDDYQNILTNEYYQISVFSKNVIEPWNNFNVIYPNSINESSANSNDIVQALFWLAGCILLSVVLIAVSYIFLRYMLKGEIGICRIRNTLGYTTKDNLKYLLIRIGSAILFAILCLSAVFGGLLKHSQSVDLSKSFIVLANIPILQFTIIVLLIGGILTSLLINFVISRSKLDNDKANKGAKND
jgi:ABC-type lipoprotein export system ATPase subunit